MKREEIKRLFVGHYAPMLRVARTMLGDGSESEDVVGDVFLDLLHSTVPLRADTERAYLLHSVRNRCLKRLRHAEVVRRMQEQASDGAMMDDDDDERLSDITEYVVAHLSPLRQRIFVLRFEDGCTYDEIAAELGISRVAVWKHISYIIRTLRNQFNSHQS